MRDDTPLFDATLAPPNGEKVTQATLYKALYDLDQGLSARFTTILDAVLSAQSLATQLRTEFEEHRKDGHPLAQHEATIRAELGLDARKLAIVGALITLVTTSVVLVTTLASGGFG